MTPTLPGRRLHRLLRQWAPAEVVRDVLEPGVADLQYEAEHAPTVRDRRRAIRRGYVAILRALILSLEIGGAIRGGLALSALCAAGTLLVATALAAHVDARVLNSALLVPGMLAPIILRMLGTTSSRRMFIASLLVAMLTPAFASNVARRDSVTAGRALALLVMLAPMAALAAIVTAPNRETPSSRAVTAVSLGSAVATAGFLLARWPHGQPLPIGLAMTPFLVALFAALFGLTLLPLLLVARAFIARPSLLAVAGLVCSPAPLIAAAYLDHHTLTACLDALRRSPLAFAASSLPFITGAMAVGWRLRPCGRSPDSPLLRS